MADQLIIGKRLKRRRTELRLTLRELAAKASLTASSLSQIERGIINPSLKSLQNISNALEVPMVYFMEDATSKSPVVRANNRKKLNLDESKASYELLTPDLTGSLEVMLRTIEPNHEIIIRKLSVETEQFIFILAGKLLVGLEDQEYVLDVGDSIRFKGNALLKLSCAADTRTQWVSVITPPVF